MDWGQCNATKNTEPLVFSGCWKSAHASFLISKENAERWSIYEDTTRRLCIGWGPCDDCKVPVFIRGEGGTFLDPDTTLRCLNCHAINYM